MPKSEPLPEIGLIKPRTIEAEMQESYLDYAMSVIVSRALPDVRDGLKPVHRRILYAMQNLGLRHNAKTTKSAKVVGEVIGKYHPHGDTAVYDSMVHLAQEFSLRYPLVIGQGNFGSVDGDRPAAMRYTEAKMSQFAEAILEDLEKDTVDFRENYDATEHEPVVLPGKLPNLLLNGTLGIAVGMATNIPPHNLNEICNAILALIEDPEIALEQLCDHVTGPDFPTGGIIYDKQVIRGAYMTGKASIVMRAKAEIEEMSNGMQRIVVTEIPYQVNKATLLERIADLVRDKKLEGIKDVRDESDKDGLRVVVELKRDSIPNKLLNQLYSYTQLQETFHVNMTGLVGGIEPQVLNLKSILENYLEHRRTVVRRRTEYELRRAKDRAHILEGLKIALDHIDEVIKTIRSSPTKEEAFQNLVKKFKLSDLQAQAILEMRLQTLAGLERKKIEDELAEKLALIARLEGILASIKKIMSIIADEVKELQNKFGDERRTLVIPHGIGQFNVEDLIPESACIISITKSGYIKRQTPDTYRQQTRGGKGVIGQTLKEEDVIDQIISASSHDDIFFFTNTGRVFVAKAYELPESSRVSKGQALVNFLQLQNGETAATVLATPKDNQSKYLVMATTKGLIKKVNKDEFSKVRRSGMIAIGLKPGDELGWVKFTSGEDEIMMTTSDGQAIRFAEKDLRPMGRNAAGVTGMKLRKNDYIIEMDVVSPALKAGKPEVLVLTENGMGKRTDLSDYKVQKRSGSGVKTVKITPKTGKMVAMAIMDANRAQDLIVVSKSGQTIRMSLAGISTLSRATQGVRIIRLDDGDIVATATIV